MSQKLKKSWSRTITTGTFGDNAEGGWWAHVGTMEHVGSGTGLTEREAIEAAERDLSENRRPAD